ncbi:glycosyltransferase family 39 protein [candidate division FCPU426 bacterium]|nr:glycosyltransferase family 39 protein [candidate division FCPU426 bacterium]
MDKPQKRVGRKKNAAGAQPERLAAKTPASSDACSPAGGDLHPSVAQPPAARPEVFYFQCLLGLGALFFVIVYIVLALLRMPYPYELEWIEGGMLDHIYRILAGQKIYVPPSLAFSPAIYTPLYFYLGAGICQLAGGAGFFPLRLVSFLASLASFSLIAFLVWRETRHGLAAFLAAGLFAATYRISGAWFDLARIDSVFLFLLLATLVLLRWGDRLSTYAAAGFSLGLAFLTKQSALVAFMPLTLWLLWQRPKHTLAFIGAACLVIFPASVVLDRLHQGWYGYYIFSLLRQQPLLKKVLITFWTHDLLRPLWVAAFFSLVYLVRPDKSTPPQQRFFYLAAAAGWLGASWISRLHYGGYDNVLFPAYAIGAIFFGLAFWACEKSLHASCSPRRPVMHFFFLLLALVQFAWLYYPPARQLPSASDRVSGKNIVGLIRKYPGEVLVPSHGYLAVLAGKRSWAHTQMLSDTILLGPPGPVRDALVAEIRTALKGRRFSAIIVNYNDPLFLGFFGQDLKEFYRLSGGIQYQGKDFLPVTGMLTRPAYIFIPLQNGEAAGRPARTSAGKTE